VEYFQKLSASTWKSMKSKTFSAFGKRAPEPSPSAAAVPKDGQLEGAWGMATANLDVAADRALAYTWHTMSNHRNTQFEKSISYKLVKMQVDVPGSHSTFTVTSQRLPFPGVKNRIFSAKWAWRREEDGTFVAGFTHKGKKPRPHPPPPETPPLTLFARAQAPTRPSSGHSRKMSGRRAARGAPLRAS
jgi:hypothetical protein